MDWPRDRARPGMIDWVSPWLADLFRPRELGEGEGGEEKGRHHNREEVEGGKKSRDRSNGGDERKNMNEE